MKSSVPVSAQWRSANTSATIRPSSVDPLEIGPPGAEQLLGPTGRRLADAEEGKEGSLHPLPLRLGDEALDRLAGLLASRGDIIGFQQAGPRANHLAEGPEGDPLAVRRGAALVPDRPVQPRRRRT